MRKNIIIFTCSNVIGLILNTVSSLWMANIAGPKLMGMYNALMLLVNYSPILTLGTINGLNRELPYMIGKGENERAQRLASTSHFSCLFVSGAIALVLAIVGAISINKGSYEWGVGFLCFACLVPISLIRSFVEVTYRTGYDFVWLSWVKLFSSILAIATVPILYFFIWEGVLFRAIVISLFGFILLWIKRKLITYPKWDQEATASLVKVGLPIFIVGYLYAGVLNLDRVLIGAKLGVAALGIYTPAILILQGMAVVPMSVMQVMYPRLAELYGKTGSAKTILPLLFKPLPMLFLVQFPFVIVGWVLIPDLIHKYMPMYLNGIDAAKWAVIAGFVLSLSCPGLAFNILRKQIVYGTIILLSGCVLLLTAMLLINVGLGLKGVAIALTSAFTFFVLMCSLFSIIICTSGTD